MKIISKKQAVMAGLRFYFTGKPCPQNHISQRYVSSNTCQECEIIRRANLTKEQANLNWKKYYEKNKEKHKARAIKYKRENVKYYKDYKKKYYEANKERLKKYSHMACHKRNALKKKSGGEIFLKDIEKMLVKQSGNCANCLKKLKKYHIDHIMPISKGGRNDIKNIQILCPNCNLRKSAKLPEKWAIENGRLI